MNSRVRLRARFPSSATGLCARPSRRRRGTRRSRPRASPRFCFRRPAHRSISSRISKRAATPFGRTSPNGWLSARRAKRAWKRGDRAHGFEGGTRPRRRLGAHRGPMADRVVRGADGDRPGDGAGGKSGSRRAAQSLDLPLRQPPSFDADPDGGVDDCNLVPFAATCATGGVAGVCRVVRAHHSRAHVRRGGQRGEALDLRPTTIGVHQTGVRRSRCLGFHRRRADRADCNSGQAFVVPAAADRDCAAHPRARLRSDDAGRGCVDGALLPGRSALVLGGRYRGHGHGRRVRRIQTVAARTRARFALSRSGLDGRVRRYFSGRHRVAEHSLRRLAWTGTGRGRLQTNPARRAHRLCLCRDRRRIWHDRLHGADRVLRLHCPARAYARCAKSRPVLPARGRRTDSHVWSAELDQHGRQLTRHAGQGNDLAVHLLRRLFFACARPRHGLPHRDDAEKTGRRSRPPGGDGGMSSTRSILLAAGGTGGHLFPAAALAAALAKRGAEVELATDSRALKFGGDFPARAIHAFPSATTTEAGALAKARASLTLGAGFAAAAVKLSRIKPRAVVGFGGYPTVPPLLAAWLLRIPTVLHEQNAVMGRANRFLSPRVNAIACGFPGLKGVDQAKMHVTGNPVRPSVIAAAVIPYPEPIVQRLNLLVTGGSQGARVMSDVVPAALALLTPDERQWIRLTQQARGEDSSRVAAACARMSVPVEIAEFFSDLPTRIAAAHLVIGRAGASTVSELAVTGRASVLVPFPHALDQDQAANAAALAKSGGATVVPQTEFTPERLAAILRDALAAPASLQAAAMAAKSIGVPDAAERLAELVLEIARPV